MKKLFTLFILIVAVPGFASTCMTKITVDGFAWMNAMPGQKLSFHVIGEGNGSTTIATATCNQTSCFDKTMYLQSDVCYNNTPVLVTLRASDNNDIAIYYSNKQNFTTKAGPVMIQFDQQNFRRIQ